MNKKGDFMNNKNKEVLGIYKTRSDVEGAIESLKSDGFSHSDISVLMPELSGSQDFSHVKSTKAPEGTVNDTLTGMGIPEYEAKRYEGFLKDGGILLSVHTDSPEQLEKAKKCLERTGATEISSTSEAKSEKEIPTFRQAKDSSTSPSSLNP